MLPHSLGKCLRGLWTTKEAPLGGEVKPVELGLREVMTSAKVLVVEDSPRRVKAMRGHGLVPEDAWVAETSVDAVEAIQRKAWVEVWLDFDLLGSGTGADAARALAAAPWRPEIVHIHSTNTSGGIEMRDILAGAGIQAQWIPITKLLPEWHLD